MDAPFDLLVPKLLADRFVIRPQRLDDNESDFQAVMANRDWLRRWSGSSWPADDFSLEENLADLAGHIEDHRSRVALGFSIISTASRQVIGSLYVQRVGGWLDEYAATEAMRRVVTAMEARVDVWARLDQEPDLLTRVVVAAVSWFAADWPPKAIFCSRADCPELEQAYEAAGLRRIGELRSPEGRLQRLFRPPMQASR